MSLSGPLLYFLAAGVPLGLAFLLDISLGDPKESSLAERLYPPVLVGNLALGLSESIPRAGRPQRERALGTLVWFVTVGTAVIAALLLCVVLAPLWLAFLQEGGPYGNVRSWIPAIVVLVLFVFWTKSLFTTRGLVQYCLAPLGKPLEEKRTLVSRVVNRPTAELPDALLNSALIESLAENTTDSIVSPLLYYAFLGLPGAVFYRSVNTLDALMGHRDRHWIHVGAFAAKVDRVANWPGERLSSTFLGTGKRAEVQTLDPEVRAPRSIVAMASSLGVRLERKGSYVIGKEWAPPGEEDVRRAARKVKRASLFALAMAASILGVMAVVGWTFFL